MKKIIKPAVKEVASYICDICGEEISQDSYGTSVVEIVVHDVVGNGWNEWPETTIYHCHRKCICTAIEFMKNKRSGKI